MDIVFKNFYKSFLNIKVFEDFNCVFSGGEISVIMAPSGAGKTTLLNAVAGLIEYKGIIEVGSKSFDGKCNVDVSYVFQEPRLVPQKTVLANLEFALFDTYKDKRERKQKIADFLQGLGLGDALNQYPHELSGGMAQRVALARAFLYPSDILLLDEPFKGLDQKIKDVVIKTFCTLWEKDKRTTLFVTHDISDAHTLNAKIYQLGDRPIGGDFSF